MRKASGSRAIAGFALSLALLGFSQVTSAFADEPKPASSASPSVHLPSGAPSTVLDQDDEFRSEELEHRYGPDRDIAAPPVLVKRSSKNPKAFVSEPLKIVHPSNITRPAGVPEPPSMLPHVFNATRNQPVISNLVENSFESPAQEFQNKAYLGLGMLAAVALVLGGVVAVRYRARGNAMDDFDYQTPSPSGD